MSCDRRVSREKIEQGGRISSKVMYKPKSAMRKRKKVWTPVFTTIQVGISKTMGTDKEVRHMQSLIDQQDNGATLWWSHERQGSTRPMVTER